MHPTAPGAVSGSHGHAADGHRALIYEDPSEFVDGAASFVRSGLAQDDRVMAVVGSQKSDWLREELGCHAAEVEFVAADDLYARLGPMFTAVLGFLERHGGPGRGRARVVAENPLASQRAADVRAYMRYEAASNVAYDNFAATVLCPYDAARLSEEIIEAALHTHPGVVVDGGVQGHETFMDPRVFVHDYVEQRAAPPGTADFPLTGFDDIAEAREWTRVRAQGNGLDRRTVEDLTLAVSEIATNALLHGAEPRRLWIYAEDGHLVCQVRDGGHGPADPLVGYLPPDTELMGGRGLWIAHQLCDTVEVASDGTRTDVYLRMQLPTA